MSEINFLRNRRKKLTKLQQLDKRLMKFSIYGFIGLIVIFLIVFGTHLFFNRRLKTILESQDLTTQQILTNESVEKDFVLMMSKVDILSKIYEQRRDKQEAIRYFSNIFGPKVTIKQIEYTGTDNLLTFILAAEDVFSIDDVLTFLNSDEVKEKFIQVTPSNLRRKEDAEYQLNIAVVLKTIE